LRYCKLAKNSSIAGPIMSSEMSAETRHNVHQAPNSTGCKITSRMITAPSGPCARRARRWSSGHLDDAASAHRSARAESLAPLACTTAHAAAREVDRVHGVPPQRNDLPSRQDVQQNRRLTWHPLDPSSLPVCAARHTGARGAVAPQHSQKLTPVIQESVDGDLRMSCVVSMKPGTSV
jgi:hypothetical protein